MSDKADVPTAESSRAEGRPNPPAGRRFQKGQSGNPGGRPKRLAELEAEIREIHGPRALEVLEKLRGLSLTGDVHAAKVYLDRVMGPARVPAEPLRSPPREGASPAEGRSCAADLIERTLGLVSGQVAALEQRAASDGLTQSESLLLTDCLRTLTSVLKGEEAFLGANKRRLAGLSTDELEEDLCRSLGITVEQLHGLRGQPPAAAK